MDAELLASLQHMQTIADRLLARATVTDLERKFLTNIADETRELLLLIISLPDYDHERVKSILSYEGRSRLSSIIGYAEVLLEENDFQPAIRDQLESLHAGGEQILTYIETL